MITSNLQKIPARWIIVPAAGIGTRMGSAVPKQYLSLGHQTILEHTLERLLSLDDVSAVYLALSDQDSYWSKLSLSTHPRIERIIGGAERSHSVINCLNHIRSLASDNDWVMVHDAARPCVTLDSLQKLLNEVGNHLVGGILGVPVSDTLKWAENKIISTTIDRHNLWHAQTPQMFRYGLLRQCLSQALNEGRTITDEASALEIYGYSPIMVAGRSDNIKITRPEDLALAELILHRQSL